MSQGMSAKPARLPLHQVLRLGTFQGCLGCLAVIFAGMLNRVMISELAFPALLVGGALAFEQLVAPSRVLFGQISDAHPLLHRYRTPYIWIGTALFCGLAVASIPLIFWLAGSIGIASGGGPAPWLGVLALCGLFAAYGLAISMASTPYLALVIDLTDEDERPRAVGFIWCMLTVGIVIGAFAISRSLKELDGVSDPALLQPVLQAFMERVALVVLGLTLASTLGIEPAAGAGLDSTAQNRQEITLDRAWRVVTSSRQIFVFFAFLVLFTLGLFLQDPILESYGAEVFAMPISATTALNALWGIGTLAGLLLAGLVIIPRIGKLATARLGSQLILASLLLLLLAGAVGQVPLLKVVMVLFGLAAGIGTNSALSLMLDLTLPQVAGTFVGVWGLAQALSRAMGKLIGGGLLDLGRLLLPGEGAFPPFALVLGVEALVMAGAIVVLGSVSVARFRDDTRHTFAEVMALDLD